MLQVQETPGCVLRKVAFNVVVGDGTPENKLKNTPRITPFDPSERIYLHACDRPHLGWQLEGFERLV